MIVACPACKTRYLVSPAALGPAGRVVRCARCAHTWREAPPEGLPQTPVEPPPLLRVEPPSFIGRSSEDYRVQLPAIARQPRPRWPAVGAAIAAALLVAVLGVATLARGAVVKTFPAASRLYGAAGWPVAVVPPRFAFALNAVTSSRADKDGRPLLVLSGEIVNASTAQRSVPMLRIVFSGPDQKAIRTETTGSGLTQLKPGEIGAFRAEIADPPAEGGNVTVTFETGATG